MTLQQVFIEITNYAVTFFSMVEAFCKMLFQDLTIFGVALGWWFLIFAFITFVITKLFNG